MQRKVIKDIMTELQELIGQLKTVLDSHSVAPRWLSIRQACLYASMSENKLKEHINEGDIYATKKGGKVFVDKESIDTFMLADSAEVEKTLARIQGGAV